jgi:hypothetical protein
LRDEEEGQEKVCELPACNSEAQFRDLGQCEFHDTPTARGREHRIRDKEDDVP